MEKTCMASINYVIDIVALLPVSSMVRELYLIRPIFCPKLSQFHTFSTWVDFTNAKATLDSRESHCNSSVLT
jgi:hypothetical protein